MTMKKFFLCFLAVALFFIFSQIAIAVSINTTYKYKSYEIKTEIPMTANIEATNVNAVIRGKIINNTRDAIKDKFIKIECYSKNDVLLGTKYIEIENINTNDTFEYEIRCNYNRVDKAVIDIVDEIPEGVEQEDLNSDPKMNLAMLVTALILLYIV